MALLLVALLGVCTGLRTLTPIAVLSWFAYLHALHLVGWHAFAASLVSVILFTAMALGEYIGDKLPTTPSRTSAVGLIGRSCFGALAGLLLAQPLALNTTTSLLIGVLGALIGAYAGWFVRTRSVVALRSADWPVAVIEDVIAIGASITLLNAVVAHAV